MTIKEFYEIIGGDYEMAMLAFRTEEKLYKFLKKYISDPSYQRMCDAASIGDCKETFEGAHALKGVSGMFYFTPVYKATSDLVEQLRSQKISIDQNLLEKVKENQQFVLAELEKIQM